MRGKRFRHSKKSRLPVVFASAAVLLVLAAAIFLIFGNQTGWINPFRTEEQPKTESPAGETGSEYPEDGGEKPEPQPEPQPEPEVEPASVSFYAVGDNLIHGAIYKQALDRGGDRYDFSYAYQHLKETVSGADIAVINQETVINDYTKPSHYPLFSTPLSMLDELIGTGFDVANIATNHMLDKGTAGLENALGHYQASSLVTSGAFLGEEDREKVRIVERNGMKFAFIGVTAGTNGIPLPEDSEIVINFISDEEEMQQQIALAKEQADFVFVMAHWGTEYSTEADEAQKAYAQKLADWGADMIIGHHPHVIEPIGTVTSSSGKAVPVAYSLGNFISAQDQPERLIGAALSFTVSRKSDGTIEVENLTAEPVVTHMGSGFSNIRVYRFCDYPDSLASEHMFAGRGWSKEYISDFFSSVMGDFARYE